MPKLVVDGATLRCSMGAAPARLVVPPLQGVDDVSLPMATVQDYKPLANVLPFAMCRSTANPQVALATAASLGVLTPQPCVPVVLGPWTPGSDVVTVNDLAALTDASVCACAWAGSISVAHPGTEGLEDS
jgi:hypothetical protein